MSEAKHVIDRSGWPVGPWDWEPDREEWRHGEMPCLIVRARSGALCGYVGVPPGHPWHGLEMFAVPAEVHGGITYTNPCQEGGAICHVARPGEPENVWWIGFDCAHSGDYTPRDDPRFEYMHGYRYRTMDYVRSEVESLADQAIAAATGEPPG